MPFLLSILLCLSTSIAYSVEDLSVQGMLGFERGVVNLGADVDFKIKRSHSVGGTFLYGAEDSSIRNSFWTLGGDIKVYFGPSDWKLYIAPGLGVSSFEQTGGGTEIAFGSLVKIGALFEVAFDMYFGLEVMSFQNWFNDKIFGHHESVQAAFRVDL